YSVIDLCLFDVPAWRLATFWKVKYSIDAYGHNPLAYFKPVIKFGGTEYLFPPNPANGQTGGTKRIRRFLYRNNPLGAAWTQADADAFEFGVTHQDSGIPSGISFDFIGIRLVYVDAAVRTLGATDFVMGGTTATLNGEVLEDEGESSCQVYFQYGPTTAYGSTTARQDKIKGEFFGAAVTGIAQGWHYRAVIVTRLLNGSSYSDSETFYGDDVTIDLDKIYVYLGTVATPELHEITDDLYPMCLGARTERGRDEELGHAAAGVCELVCDNHFGDFSPENVAGHYYGQLVLGAVITVFEIYQGVRYNHFKGKIDKIVPQADPKNLIAYILAVDGMDDLAGSEIDTPLLTTTETGALVDDILDAVEWPVADRSIDAGVDVLEIGWFHKMNALEAIQECEETEKGFFYIDEIGKATYENRHHRLSGDHLVSQGDFEDTMVALEYEYSKRDLKNYIRVSGYKYVKQSASHLIWSIWSGGLGAPVIESGGTLEVWASAEGPIESYTTPIKNTHWNGNSAYDGTGTDLSNSLSLVVTRYGQSLKLVFTSTAAQKVYLVPPVTPPGGAPTDQTILIYGYLYDEAEMSIVKYDQASIDLRGKRTYEVEAHFKANPNDVAAYANWLLLRYKDPHPTPVAVKLVARTNWPDKTIRIACLTRKISDRITLKSTKLAFDKDFFINKVVQDYLFQEGGVVHETTWFVEDAAGSAEGAFWLLGVPGFSELGETTILGF
ncbi:MAG: hypothetical protein M0R06_10305, partial [Sphaerochaeta sp.]|nr:hypothetical protein [Sphaerochaeta sp.]